MAKIKNCALVDGPNIIALNADGQNKQLVVSASLQAKDGSTVSGTLVIDDQDTLMNLVRTVNAARAPKEVD